MVHSGAAAKPPLEFERILAEVMQQPCRSPEFGATDGAQELRRLISSLPQVLGQRMPVLACNCVRTVREIIIHSLIVNSSSYWHQSRCRLVTDWAGRVQHLNRSSPKRRGYADRHGFKLSYSRIGIQSQSNRILVDCAHVWRRPPSSEYIYTRTQLTGTRHEWSRSGGDLTSSQSVHNPARRRQSR